MEFFIRFGYHHSPDLICNGIRFALLAQLRQLSAHNHRHPVLTGKAMTVISPHRPLFYQAFCNIDGQGDIEKFAAERVRGPEEEGMNNSYPLFSKSCRAAVKTLTCAVIIY
ncbi:hypothetical protein [Enterobacter sp. R1(2018)]|uniref:hypothetical protein n=1 Tax=Enterobacter sp. R1(2018) TaxID=2447891 RepID=UPI000EAE58A4|nr:hypothetical protein [Enterobacter sp. R1(2018)]RKQ38613.1 hypothetical protein D8M09_17050 [Enterobacter sp. R1(2018)]